jgi:hypothetical protein
MKGVHSFGSVGYEKKREIEDWNCCQSRTWDLVLLCVHSGKLVGWISLWNHTLIFGVVYCLEKLHTDAYA